MIKSSRYDIKLNCLQCSKDNDGKISIFKNNFFQSTTDDEEKSRNKHIKQIDLEKKSLINIFFSNPLLT